MVGINPAHSGLANGRVAVADLPSGLRSMCGRQWPTGKRRRNAMSDDVLFPAEERA
jgi:hypothetical protein